MDVNDRPAESGIKLNNIISALILAAILWVGSSIESIKDKLTAVIVTQSEIRKDVTYNTERDKQRDERININVKNISENSKRIEKLEIDNGR